MSRADFIRFEPHLPPLLPPPGGHRTRCERALAALPRPTLLAIGAHCLEHTLAAPSFSPQLREVLAALREGRGSRASEFLTKPSIVAPRQLAATHAIAALRAARSSERPAQDLAFALAMLVAASEFAFTELAWQSELLARGAALERRIVQISHWTPVTNALSLDEFVSSPVSPRLVGAPNLRIAQWLDGVPHGSLTQFCQQLFATTARELAPMLDGPDAAALVRTLEYARTPDAAVRCLIERWLRDSKDLRSRRAHALRAVADASRALVHPELAPVHASDAIKLRAAAAENHVTSWLDSMNLLLTCTNVPSRL